MDDVKQDLSLGKIGIPIDGNGCKIVLTTRHAHVCPKPVSVTVKVPYLSNDEAWAMFRDVLNCPSLIENHEIGPLAWDICTQCGGLPLLVEKIASTFRVKNDACLWREGLNSWRTWPKKECQGVKEMINFFKICCNDLDAAQKQCFLYGALYPEDTNIYKDYLLERWRAEEFFVIGKDYRKGNEAVSGSTILSHLKDVSLLEEDKDGKYVSMHKFIRQVALDISSNETSDKYLVKTDGASIEPMDVESWCQERFISLSNNVEFNKLPNHPDGRELSTLFLQKNSDLKEVPESFFNNMTKLRVLDFCESGITSLPESLPSSLKVLCLSNCKDLTVFPLTVKDYSYLEVLDISCSGINGIPTHIENMKVLRCLRISLPDTEVENVIENGFKTISKLPKLEELVINMKRSDRMLKEAVIKSIIKNMATLESFTTLRFSIGDQIVNIIKVGPGIFQVQVPDAEILRAFSKTKCFEQKAKHLKFFQIFIDCDTTGTPGILEYVRCHMYIKYLNGKDDNLIIPIQFNKSNIAFELVAHKNIKELSNFNLFNITNNIEVFFVGSCEKVETIIGKVDSEPLQNIKHLCLDKLPKLESIWKEPWQPTCLINLETLSVSGCHLLKKIFPRGTVQQLIELKTLRIENCSEIVEIIEESDPMGTSYELPKLRTLIIIDMPKLEFISKEKSLRWPSLEEFQYTNCPCLKNVSSIQANAPKLDINE